MFCVIAHCRFCGSTIPSAITIDNNVTTVQFRTDGSIGFQGFSAYYVRYNPNSGKSFRLFQ